MAALVLGTTMNETPMHRLAAWSGLVLAAAVGVWWIGSTRLALADSADPSRSAIAALHASYILRAMMLALTAPRIAATHGWRQSATQALLLCAPSWPPMTLAWAASTTALSSIALAEGLLLTSGLGLALAGHGLRHAVSRTDVAQLLATAGGATLAAAVWASRLAWTLAPS